MDKNKESAQLLSIYTQAQAIEDGVLVKCGEIKGIRIIFTANLFKDYKDDWNRKCLILRGLKMIAKPHPEDTSTVRPRVIEGGKIWVIWDGDGITFLKPEDY